MDTPDDTSSMSYKMPILSMIRDDTCTDSKEYMSSPVSTGARSKVYTSQSHYSVNDFDDKLQMEVNLIDSKINELRQSMDCSDEKVSLSRSNQTPKSQVGSSQFQSASSCAEYDKPKV